MPPDTQPPPASGSPGGGVQPGERTWALRLRHGDTLDYRYALVTLTAPDCRDVLKVMRYAGEVSELVPNATSILYEGPRIVLRYAADARLFASATPAHAAIAAGLRAGPATEITHLLGPDHPHITGIALPGEQAPECTGHVRVSAAGLTCAILTTRGADSFHLHSETLTLAHLLAAPPPRAT
ncbi:MAG: hypothetical protein AB1941_00655 [Gemmatimonadota bacterium]